jgi:large subunit ribosomal protein L9
MTEVILLEKLGKDSNIGDVVNVKGGFARNYLFPRKKALRATEENKRVFEEKRVELEAEHAKKVSATEELAVIISEVGTLVMRRQAADDGHLYGSVSTKDIAIVLSEKIGREIVSDAVCLHEKLKALGEYKADIVLYSGITVEIGVVIERE